jgi:YhcH/YjgK/YiaL family protein
MATSLNNNNPEKWSDEVVDLWYEKQDWLEGWKVSADVSINRRTFAIEYHKSPERWKKAFAFLKETDLINLPTEKHELDGKNLFVAVSEYNSKELNETKYEAHKKYVDIQYVISGEEQLGVTPLESVNASEPYNEEKDLIFYKFEGGNFFKANPNNFFIFFPEDVHRPCIKTTESVPVKKLVVKLLLE